MRSRLLAALLGVAVSLGILVVDTAPASAHGGATAGVVSVAQTLGRHELTVTMNPPAGGTGPMPVQIVARSGTPDGSVLLQAVPATGAPTSEAVVTPRIGTPATGTLQIDRPGAWEIVLVDGPDVARIPLSVAADPPTPLWTSLLRAGLVAALVGVVSAAAAVGYGRLRTALGLGATALVGASMATTAILLSSSSVTPGPTAAVSAPAGAAGHAMPGTPMSGPGMPGMSTGSATTGGSGAVVVTPNLRPGTDGLVALALAITDGSTGAPVDDLVIHDDALIHLAVIGPGHRLWHVHPVRIAPGRFSVRLPLSDAGRYGVFAEMERADGGHQVTRSAFTLDAAPGPGTAPGPEVAAAGGPGPRDVAGMRAEVTVTTPVAGRGSRVELAFSENGQPVRNLQAWLGMAGHLMVLGPATTPDDPDPTDPAVSFAHIHDMAPPSHYGYGPSVGFDYAFPAAGRYQLWAQVQHDWQLVTIPITVDVQPAPPA